MSRNKIKAFNKSDQYKKVLEDRGVKVIEQYRTPIVKAIPNTTPSFEYIWKQGDAFWRLSHKFYGDKQYWYVIAQFNNKPTESHINIGDTINIPYDVNEALQVLR